MLRIILISLYFFNVCSLRLAPDEQIWATKTDAFANLKTEAIKELASENPGVLELTHFFNNRDPKIVKEYCQEDNKRNEHIHSDCPDPFMANKMCKNAYQIPLYSLGDLFFEKWAFINGKHWFEFYFPKSVAVQYVQNKTHPQDYETMDRVLNSEEYQDFERPDSNTVVIHLRGFDAILQGNRDKYTKDKEFYESAAKNASQAGFSKAVIVTGDHVINQRANTSSTQKARDSNKARLEKALNATVARIKDIEQVFESNGFRMDRRMNYNADCDFIYMANSKAFVPSGGGFDMVIENMVRRKNGRVFGSTNKKR